MSQILPSNPGIKNRRRLILHAGFPKTGTTFVQNKLFKHRAALLAAHGILMPSLNANLTDALCTMFHDDPMVHITNLIDQLTPSQLKRRKMAYFESLEADLTNNDWRSAIFLAEGVVNLNYREMAKLKRWGDKFDADWEVFYCIRDPVDWVRSVVQELIKGGKTLEQLYENIPLPHYRRIIKVGSSVFGKDSLRVYSFATASAHPDGILGHFLGMLGAPTTLLSNKAGEQKRENSSMSQEAVMILDRLNSLRPLFDERGKIGKQRTGQEVINILRIKGQNFNLPKIIEQKVRDSSEADELWLRNKFDINLRQTNVVRHQSAHASLPPSTATSVAILISDLLNQVRSQALAPQIDAARAISDFAKAASLIGEVERLAPR